MPHSYVCYRNLPLFALACVHLSLSLSLPLEPCLSVCSCESFSLSLSLSLSRFLPCSNKLNIYPLPLNPSPPNPSPCCLPLLRPPLPLFRLFSFPLPPIPQPLTPVCFPPLHCIKWCPLPPGPLPPDWWTLKTPMSPTNTHTHQCTVTRSFRKTNLNL